MTKNDFELLKRSNDPFEFHLIGAYYYRAGTYGIGKYNKKFKEVGHSNDFRNKDFNTCKKELNTPIINDVV